MGIEFASQEWILALKEELNNSPAYADAAKKWEGDFYFIVNAGEKVTDDIYLYMDLWHGECRDAFLVEDASVKSPEFKLMAPLNVWKGVMDKKINPIQGLMSGKLKLDGPMMKILKSPKAATELVECCTKIDTTWPA